MHFYWYYFVNEFSILLFNALKCVSALEEWPPPVIFFTSHFKPGDFICQALVLISRSPYSSRWPRTKTFCECCANCMAADFSTTQLSETSEIGISWPRWQEEVRCLLENWSRPRPWQVSLLLTSTFVANSGLQIWHFENKLRAQRKTSITLGIN